MHAQALRQIALKDLRHIIPKTTPKPQRPGWTTDPRQNRRPWGLVRIRHFGLFANRRRAAMLLSEGRIPCLEWLTSLRSTSVAAVFSHATPSCARSTPVPSKYGSRWLLPALHFITPLCRHPFRLLFFPARAAPISAHPHPHPNPIDSTASTIPAAHFKRLYRNCPTTSHAATATSSRGCRQSFRSPADRLSTRDFRMALALHQLWMTKRSQTCDFHVTSLPFRSSIVCSGATRLRYGNKP
jgi:hypothetical protein